MVKVPHKLFPSYRWKVTALVVCGILVVGLLLQWSVGGIRWSLLAWPVNIIVLVLFLLLLVGMHGLRKRVYCFGWLSHYTATVPSLVCVAAITVIMGLVRQVPSTHPSADVIGFSKMLSFWPFVLLYSWLVTVLGMTILRVATLFKLRKIPFLLNHVGLFVVLLTATLGNADMQRLTMITQLGKTEWRAMDEDGKLTELLFAIVALLFWELGAFAAWRGKRPAVVYTFTSLGLVVFFSFIVGMWISLERPPMRTMGETRLWYSFFLPLAGIITYSRWKYKWILGFSTILSLVFVCINIFKPEIHNKTLMPALQSPWFTPHVVVYMFAYAMLGTATVMAVYLLWFKKKGIERHEMALCDNLTYVGLAFMTLGMLSGAVRCKSNLGALLDVGPQRELGGGYLVFLSGLYPFPSGMPRGTPQGVGWLACSFSVAANVLVWH